MSEESLNKAQQLVDHLWWCIETTFLLLMVLGALFLVWELGKFALKKTGDFLGFKNWREGKIFVLEDICIYSLVLLVNFGADYLHNLICTSGFADQARPVSFGWGQIFVAVVFGALLSRKVRQMRDFS